MKPLGHGLGVDNGGNGFMFPYARQYWFEHGIKEEEMRLTPCIHLQLTTWAAGCVYLVFLQIPAPAARPRRPNPF